MQYLQTKIFGYRGKINVNTNVESESTRTEGFIGHHLNRGLTYFVGQKD